MTTNARSLNRVSTPPDADPIAVKVSPVIAEAEDEVTTAKRELLAYVHAPSGPNVIQRHPALAAGAFVLGVLAYAKLRPFRMGLRIAAILILKEAGKRAVWKLGSNI